MFVRYIWRLPASKSCTRQGAILYPECVAPIAFFFVFTAFFYLICPHMKNQSPASLLFWPWQTSQVLFKLSTQQAQLAQDATQTIWMRTLFFGQQMTNPTPRGQREWFRMFSEKSDAITIGSQAWMKGMSNLIAPKTMPSPMPPSQWNDLVAWSKWWQTQQSFWHEASTSYTKFWDSYLQTVGQTVKPFSSRAAANARRLGNG